MRTFCVLVTVLFVMLVAGCKTAPPKQTKFFETPPAAIAKADGSLFGQAKMAQDQGRFEEAIELWRKFLRRNPNSYEAHNNLGELYYMEDQLSQSLREFEAAIQLEPNSSRIRKNYRRALQFQVTLLMENGDYDRSIHNLKRLKGLVPATEKQDIQFKIEKVEDQIFEQVMKSNNTRDYKDFLRKYPEGINANTARKRLEDLAAPKAQPQPSQASEIIPFDGEERISQQSGILEDTTPPKLATEITEEDISGGPVLEEEFVEIPNEIRPAPPLEPEFLPVSVPDVSIDPQSEASPQGDTDQMAYARELLETTDKVIIKIAEESFLNVRAAPSSHGEVIGKLYNGDVRPLLEEGTSWYRVEFDDGQSGWINQGFARKLKLPDTRLLWGNERVS